MSVTGATRLLTAGEVAVKFRVDPKTVTRWAAEGKLLAARTPGNHCRFYPAEVSALLRGESRERARELGLAEQARMSGS